MRPVGAVAAEIGKDLGGKAVAHLLPRLAVGAVEGVGEVNVAEQPAGVMIICVAAARAGENGEKVALLLGGDAALMRQLVRAGRGEQHRGGIHVDV